MVDVDMYSSLEGQSLEIGPTVVDVHNRVEICAVQKRHEVLIPWNQDHPKRCLAGEGVVCLDLADDHEGGEIGMRLKDGQPLGELVQLGWAIGKIQCNVGSWDVIEGESLGFNLSDIAHAAGEASSGSFALTAQPGLGNRGLRHSWPIVNAVRSLWEHRQVLRMLVLRDLQKKYTRFRLGYLWTLLEPLGMAAVLWLVFSVLLGARGFGLDPYPLFLAVAILPWWWFSKGIGASTRIWRKTGAQLRISTLPTQLWVVRALLVSMIEFLFSAFTGFLPGPWIVLFPVGIVVQFLLMYGLALLIASGSIVFPDIGRLVRIVLRAMFYLSPILYSVSNIPAGAQFIAAFNPLVGVLGLYRIGWWPEEAIGAVGYSISLGLCLIIFVAGVLTFRRLENRILKEV